jgi:nucleotide-binding universal stress UspA family protein
VASPAPPSYPSLVADRGPAGIVVGYDGGEGAEDALTLALLLARAGAWRLTLVRVVGTHDLLHGVEAALPRLLEERWESVAQMRDAAAKVGAEAETVSADSPASGLELTARELAAELLVIGSSRHGRLGQIFAGGVALRLLHGSSHAVGLAPEGYRHRAAVLRTVGAGYTDPRLERLPRLKHAEGQHAEELEQHVARLASELPPGLRVSHAIVRGDPVVVLSRHASDLDLLVVGSRGKGPVAGVLLGSVSSELVLATPCPLIVVPRR